MLILITLFIALIPLTMVYLYYLGSKRSKTALKQGKKAYIYTHPMTDIIFKSYYQARTWCKDNNQDITLIKQTEEWI